MRTVLVVGAGASLAQAMSFKPTQSRLHPPLDGNFFDKAEQVALRAPEVADRLDDLSRAVASSSLIDDPMVRPRPPMEQFFADLYYEVTTNRRAAFPAFVALLNVYTSVLAETTNWIAIRNQRYGVLDKVIRAEIDRAELDPLSILTFNHDLLIEDALCRLPKKYGACALWDLYGALPGFVDAAAPSDPSNHIPRSNGNQSLVNAQLWKLHGSLNWGTKTVARDPAYGTLFPTGKARDVVLHNSRTAMNRLSVSTHIKQGRGNWYLWPLIVPPIYDKQRLMNSALLSNVWAGARHALEHCERLVLFGYSLPEADIIGRQLLRRAFVRNELDRIEVINPDIGIARKLHDALGPRAIGSYADAEAFLQYS